MKQLDQEASKLLYIVLSTWPLFDLPQARMTNDNSMVFVRITITCKCYVNLIVKLQTIPVTHLVLCYNYKRPVYLNIMT